MSRSPDEVPRASPGFPCNYLVTEMVFVARADDTDHIKKVASKLNLTVARADDFFSTRSVMTDIWYTARKDSEKGIRTNRSRFRSN